MIVVDLPAAPPPALLPRRPDPGCTSLLPEAGGPEAAVSTPDLSRDDTGVIQFRTRDHRDADEQAAYEDAAHAEAIRMLEEALEFVRAQRGRRVTGVAIALTFSDRCYASHIPLNADNMGSLIAAVADCQYRLLRITNEV